MAPLLSGSFRFFVGTARKLRFTLAVFSAGLLVRPPSENRLNHEPIRLMKKTRTLAPVACAAALVLMAASPPPSHAQEDPEEDLPVFTLDDVPVVEVVSGGDSDPAIPVQDNGATVVLNDAAPSTAVSPLVTETLDTIIVTGKAENLLGIAPSASKGQASAEELAERPFLRRGELLEVVPGMIVTQHSGGGKANQYFVRGFNLDHGTDFAIFVDNMPVNNRTHGHGQGYADINFLIPELVEELEYVKGPYFPRIWGFQHCGRGALPALP